MLRALSSFLNSKPDAGNNNKSTNSKWKDNIKLHWNNQDKLAELIIDNLEHTDVKDLLELSDVSRHLFEIDSNRERGTCLYGINLMKLGKASEAENIFLHYLDNYPISAVILVNLAKTRFQQGDSATGLSTLEKALLINPELDNGLNLWVCLRRDSQLNKMEPDRAMLAALNEANAKFGGKLINIFLARFYADRKEYSTSFKYLEKNK